jgi:hypothetical protein
VITFSITEHESWDVKMCSNSPFMHDDDAWNLLYSRGYGALIYASISMPSLTGELLLETLNLQRGHVEFIFSHRSTQAQWK